MARHEPQAVRARHGPGHLEPHPARAVHRHDPYGERDRALKRKLRDEWSGILRWALDGCRAWHADGLQPPAAVTQATAAYRADMDVLGAFLAERCESDRAGSTPTKVLFEAYAAWCDAAGERALTKTSFGAQLKDRGLTSEKLRGAHTWLGITLRDAS